MPALISEGRYASDWLKEYEHDYSVEEVIIISGSGIVDSGTVVGKITTAVTAPSTAYAGTGTGTITMDATSPVLPGAKIGAYTATAIAAAANGGTFRVEDPDGFVLGDVAVGATFSDDVKFVINDGATDFVVGDKFTITVATGSGKYKVVTLAATDGSQNAGGIVMNMVDATSADAAAVIVARKAKVVHQGLKYGADVTTAAHRAAIHADLGALNPPILVREGA